jgi:hypothetical protein
MFWENLSQYYQYSQNKRDSLKQKTSHSFMVYCITYFVEYVNARQLIAVVIQNWVISSHRYITS